MKRDEHIKLSKQAELSEPELESLKHSVWEIDCPQLTVKSRSPQNVATFDGPGFLKQVTSHQLTFKFYAKAQSQSHINRNIQLGETIPDEAYYDLTAMDYKGRLWRCERILIYIETSASGELIIQGSIPKIICEGEIPEYVECKGSRLEIRVFDDINIPCNERTLTKKSIAGGA
jgi:hypothetical protein